MLVMSAVMKLTQAEGAVKGFAAFGYDPKVLVPLGVVELVCVILYVIPQTAVLGAILLTGYLGGADGDAPTRGRPVHCPSHRGGDRVAGNLPPRSSPAGPRARGGS